jgi:hypothetical protein
MKEGPPRILQHVWANEIKCRKYGIGLKKLTTDEIKNEILLRTNNDGRTAWHLAAWWGEVDLIKGILEMAKKKLRKEEIVY